MITFGISGARAQQALEAMAEYFLQFRENIVHVLEDSPGACIVRIDWDMSDEDWRKLNKGLEADYGVVIEERP